MLWIALGVFWLLGAVGRPKFWLRFGWTDAAVLLLVAWHTVAALWAVGHGTPRPAVNMLWEWVGMGLCFFLARQLIVTPREGRAVAAVMVALAVAVSGYGLYQCAYELPQTRAMYEADPDRALRDAGLWFPPDSPERKLFEDRLANTEPMATFALTNSLAAFLAPWLVVLAGMHRRFRCETASGWLAMLVCLIPHCRVSAVDEEPQRICRGGRGVAAGVAAVPRAKSPHRLEAAGCRWRAVVLLIVGGRGGRRARGDRQGVEIVRLPAAILAVEPADDRRPSVAGLRAGQLPGRLYPVQIARGQRGDRRSAQFPAGDLGHRRHAGRVAFLAVLGCFAWACQGRGDGRREDEGSRQSDESAIRNAVQSPIPNP